MQNARPTLRSLAAELGLSKSTVSLALRHSSELCAATRERVQDHARKSGYTKDAVMAQLMARMRAQSKPRLQGNLALISFDADPAAWRHYRCSRDWTEGAERRAHMLGYATDRFSAFDQTPTRLVQILQSRNIQGFVISVPIPDLKMGERFLPLLHHFASACTGQHVENPSLHHTHSDIFINLRIACEKLRRVGRKLIGLVVNEALERVMQGMYRASYEAACRAHGLQILPVFDMDAGQKAFGKWLDAHRPDALLVTWTEIRKWVEQTGRAVPAEIAIGHLDACANPGWGGIDQHHPQIGATAIDLVVGQILRNEKGIPRHPRALLISGTWKHGPTLPPEIET